MLVECDQAVEAVTSEVAGMIGGAECRARVFLRNDAGAYVAVPAAPGRRRRGDREGTPQRSRAAGDRRAPHGHRRDRAGPSVSRRRCCFAAPRSASSASSPRARAPSTPTRSGTSRALAQQISLSLDIARLRRSVQRLTTIDTLTGLKNREFLFERLAAEIARAQPLLGASVAGPRRPRRLQALQRAARQPRGQPPAAPGRQPDEDERPRPGRRRLPIRRRGVRAAAPEHAGHRRRRRRGRGARANDDREDPLPRRGTTTRSDA